MGAFLLSVASPELLSWTGFVALVIALIGEAAVYLIPKKWESVHKEAAFALAILAAGAYAVERVGDDAIIDALKDRADKAETALSGIKKSRTLTSEQAAKIAVEMQTFAGTPVVFGVFQDMEAIELLDRISSILSYSAHWREEEWKSGGDIVLTRGGGHPVAGYTFVSGVYVQADASHAADFGPIVGNLAKLLSDAGIKATAEVGRMAPNTNNDAIKILIGQKPR